MIHKFAWLCCFRSGKAESLLLKLLLITGAFSMAVGKLGVVDPTSYANYNEVVVTDIGLFLDVNFESKILSGRAEIGCNRLKKNISNLVLDAKDLTVTKVTCRETGANLNYTVSEPYKVFGSALNITLPEGLEASKFTVVVDYETSPSASGLQWLTPEQTQGKKEPYMFSQFQAIHARSAVPCQDTPGVKFTYSAEVTAPQQLTVLMSALLQGEPIASPGGRRLAKFRQPVPIPSYLIAFAAGRLESRRLGPRSSVWAEPEVLEASAYEFAETEKILDAAIGLSGDYEWKVYDLLVMPPSFPFGGMENPCITFVTPTLLAGDRSLVDVVAHEISHSWSGNLVTTASFEHFWLNEGWTMFIERKIQGKLHGGAHRDFHAIQGLESLRETVEKTLGVDNVFTKLVPDLTDMDPDDAFSVVPYEKGHTFLYYLEQLVGGPEKFDPFIKAYFAKFRNQSITTDDFKKTFLAFFKDTPEIKKIDWDGWLYSTGMPLVIPEYDTSLVNACVDLADSWRRGAVGRSALDIQSFSSEQTRLFLANLLKGQPLPLESVRRMEELYKLSANGNSEIRCLWIRVGLQAHALEFVPKALEFVNEQGRMKFVRPIYRDMYDWEETREQAIKNYHKNKGAMMFVLSNQLLKDLHIA